MNANNFSLGIGGRFHHWSLLKLSVPSSVAAVFDVNTISGVVSIVDASTVQQYEIYRATNGGAETLIGTTAIGVKIYTDANCKQNASVVYRVKAKRGAKVTDFVSSTALATPLCWKSNQSVLTPHVIQTLNIAAGKSVTVNYSDGTSQAYVGNNSNITKNFAATGQYNVSLSGDLNSITALVHNFHDKTYGSVSNWVLPAYSVNIAINSTGVTGSVTNWVLPASLLEFSIRSTGVTGSVTNWVLPASLQYFYIHLTALTGSVSNWVLPASLIVFSAYSTGITGSLPQITAHATNALNYQAQSCSLSDSGATVFRKAMTVFNIGSQTVVFPTANIDKILKALADWYQVNAPTANCTITMSGANMGIPTGGSSNTDLTRLVGYYTAAAKTATVLVRTS